jgi:uncharacterized protein YecE (DUF72 family)
MEGGAALVIYVGISGYDYPHWRGTFYPKQMPRRAWLGYASRSFNSIELNGTFYSLKTPAVFERWVAEVPAHDFVFAIKGSRFITHNLKLRRARPALANFYASGVLALGRRAGPFLWQLPATYRFDAERLDSFMSLLPRTSTQAEDVARDHDDRLKKGALVQAPERTAFRHAFEPRHQSYFHPEFYDLLRRHGFGFVIADTAGKFAYAEHVTADFVYVRLHGSGQLYVGRYGDGELDRWADKTAAWSGEGKDVYVYFDNDARGHAPHDAERLALRMGVHPAAEAGASRARTAL